MKHEVDVIRTLIHTYLHSTAISGIGVSSRKCLEGKMVHHKQTCRQKFLLGVLLKEMWTFFYCSHSAKYSPEAVEELI